MLTLFWSLAQDLEMENIFLTDMMKHVETIYYCISKFSRLFTQYFVKISFILVKCQSLVTIENKNYLMFNVSIASNVHSFGVEVEI